MEVGAGRDHNGHAPAGLLAEAKEDAKMEGGEKGADAGLGGHVAGGDLDLLQKNDIEAE